MPMKVYAERPWRLTRQIVADVALAVWCLLWIWAAVTLYHFVEKLAVPGQKLESSGDKLAASLTKFMDENKGMNYADAVQQVSAENPKLYDEYREQAFSFREQ